jgi:DNA-damage-inducible protein J
MDTVINIRTNKRLRDEARKIFEKMGLTTSAGINMFLNQVVAEKGLPFSPTIDPKKLRARWDLQVSEAVTKGKRYTDAESMLRDI